MMMAIMLLLAEVVPVEHNLLVELVEEVEVPDQHFKVDQVLQVEVVGIMEEVEETRFLVVVLMVQVVVDRDILVE